MGNAQAGQSFAVDGQLGETRYNVWDSADRLRFNTSQTVHLELDTDPNVITELVRFQNGVATVVSSVEYDDHLSLNLVPGNYGLSFFVEGDLVAYQVSASFT